MIFYLITQFGLYCCDQDLLSHSEGKKWCHELQEALDCMLVVLKCVNDSMHQTAITGFWVCSQHRVIELSEIFCGFFFLFICRQHKTQLPSFICRIGCR